MKAMLSLTVFVAVFVAVSASITIPLTKLGLWFKITRGKTVFVFLYFMAVSFIAGIIATLVEKSILM